MFGHHHSFCVGLALEATRDEFIPTDYADDGSGQQSLLSFVRNETPHLAIEYERLLAGGSSPKNAQEDEVVGAELERTGEKDVPPSSLDDRLATLQ